MTHIFLFLYFSRLAIPLINETLCAFITFVVPLWIRPKSFELCTTFFCVATNALSSKKSEGRGRGGGRKKEKKEKQKQPWIIPVKSGSKRLEKYRNHDRVKINLYTICCLNRVDQRKKMADVHGRRTRRKEDFTANL